MESGFFAMLSRMKYISRWALMRNTDNESLSEHSLETAFIAHALAVIGNKRLGKSHNAERIALLALYHDVTEILVGDMPTPVKYFNDDIRSAFGDVERAAGERLLGMLPEDIRAEYSPLILEECSAEEKRIVKAADKLSALVKCIEEKKAGNMEFSSAEKTTIQSVRSMELAEADIFMESFLPAYYLTLDEL